MKKLLTTLVLCLFVGISFGQVLTGSTLQFNGWTGNLGIGANSNNVNKLFVQGNSSTTSGSALRATATSLSGYAIGAEGYSPNGRGVFAWSNNGTGLYAQSANGFAGLFRGRTSVSANNNSNALACANNGTGAAIRGSTQDGTGLWAESTNGYAGIFVGRVSVYTNTHPVGLMCINNGGVGLQAKSQNGTAAEFQGQVSFVKWNDPSTSYMQITQDGRVGIGDPSMGSTDYKLFVQDGIATGKVKVNQTWADYVFAPEYELSSLTEIDTFIQDHGHLPNIPSETSIIEDGGFEVGTMTRLQQEKIEELFLYIIQMEKRIKTLEATLSENTISKD